MKKNVGYIAPRIKSHRIGSKDDLMDVEFDFTSPNVVSGGEINGKSLSFFEEEDEGLPCYNVWETSDDR